MFSFIFWQFVFLESDQRFMLLLSDAFKTRQIVQNVA